MAETYRPFEQTLSKNTMNMISGEVSINAGESAFIGKNTADFSELIEVGQGAIANGVNSIKSATIKLFEKTTGTAIEDGTLRIIVSDKNGLAPRIISEGLLEEWVAGKELPASKPWVPENGFVRFEVTLNTAQVIDLADANTKVILPVTRMLR